MRKVIETQDLTKQLLNNNGFGYFEFPCGARFPHGDKQLNTFPDLNSFNKRRDGMYKFSVYDSDPKSKSVMPKRNDGGTHCAIGCPATFKQCGFKKKAGRKKYKHFGNGMQTKKIYECISCHAEYKYEK